MANNYLEFSEILDELTKEEATWLEHQLEEVPGSATNEYDGDLPRIMAEASEDDPLHSWICQDMECLNFEYTFEDDPVSLIWFHTTESGSPDQVAYLVHKFLQQFRPTECWSLSWACYCSKPRINEAGGGGVFVTAAGIWADSGYDFIHRCTQQFANLDGDFVPQLMQIPPALDNNGRHTNERLHRRVDTRHAEKED